MIRIKRVGIYVIGMITVSLGIVLCAKCGLGISPVSCWPYMLEGAVPLTFGTLTMLFHFVNIIFQYITEKKIMNPRVFLQVPIAIILGMLIDLIKAVVQIDNSILLYQIVALVFSVFFTAFGMVCMINMELVQNPPDGAVRQISRMSGRELGTVKLAYDIVMVVSSCIVSYILLGYLKGLGIATIVSAIFVGRALSYLQRTIGIKIRETGTGR
ncbi:MAG: YczE/YyaS/YitT family protein [Lachnospiraceae bacterium]